MNNNCTCGDGNGVCDSCVTQTAKPRRARRDTVQCGCIQCKPAVEQDARTLLQSTNRVVSYR